MFSSSSRRPVSTSSRPARRWLHGLLALALAGGVLPLTSIVLAAPDAAAAPSQITIGQVETRVKRMSTTQLTDTYPAGECLNIAVDGGSDFTPWISAGSGYSAHASSGSSCPGAVDTTKQSTISISPRTPNFPTTTVTEGSPFLLASYKHFNVTVNGGSNYFYSEMGVRFLGTDLTLPWRLWETPNQTEGCTTGGACNDELKFTLDVAPQIITYGGEQYRLVVTGFVPPTGGTCSATLPTGATVGSTFITAEGVTTSGCLYAQVDKIRKLTITKQVTLPGGSPVPAGVTVPAFNYVTTTSLTGSAWVPDFSLTPTASTPASVTREILSSERVTFTESLPTGDQWSTGSLRCVDQAGGSVPWTGGNGANTAGGVGSTLVINNIVGLETTPSAITCTFTNIYTPKGTLTLKKAVVGAAASSFTLTASGATPISGPGNSAAVTNKRVVAGSYTLSESGPSSYRQSGPWVCSGGTLNGSVVNVADGATVTCTVTNVLKTGTLEVAKIIDDPNGGYTGAPGQAFTGTVTCTGPSGTYSWSATTGTPWSNAGVPSGSVCRVTSENAPPAGLLANTSYQWVLPTLPGNTVVVPDGTAVRLTVTNTVRQVFGYLRISKAVAPATGTPSAYTGTRSFPIGYSCTLGGSTVVSGTVNPTAAAPAPAVQIPVGATCAITEVQPTVQAGDFPDGSYAWLAPVLPTNVTVTVANTQAAPATATVKNTYQRGFGSITLAKTVSGPGAGTVVPATTFNLTYNCGTGFSGTRAVAAGASAQVTGLPLNATCTIGESPLPAGSAGLAPAYAWGTPTYPGGTSVVVGTTPQTRTVNNPTVAVYAQISLQKLIAGATGGLNAAVTFPTVVSCNAPAQGQGADYIATLAMTDVPSAATTPPLPVGTECTVTENAPAQSQLADESYVWAATPPAQTVIATPAGATVNVQITNTIKRAYGSLSITKVVSNPEGVQVTSQSFSGTWSCVAGPNGTWTIPATTTGGTTTVGAGAILLGSKCTATEVLGSQVPVTGSALYAWSPSYSTRPVTVGAGNNSPTITVTNTVRQVASNFLVTKDVTGTTAAQTGYVAGTTFTLDQFCWDPATYNKAGPEGVASGWLDNRFQLTDGQVTSAPTALPAGWNCALTESSRPATALPAGRYSWNTPSFQLSPSGAPWATGTTLPALPAGTTMPANPASDMTLQFVVPLSSDGALLTVRNPIVINTTSLTVGKAVTGATSGLVGGSTFPITVNCGADGTYGPYNVANGATQTVPNVPIGASCTVSEGSRLPAQLTGASYQWGSVSYASGGTTQATPIVVPVAANGQTAVTVTNNIERVVSSVSLSKVLIDPDDVVAPATNFSGTWSCVLPEGGSPRTGSWTTTAGNTTVLATDIPLTSTCSATEAAPSAPSATDPSYTWAPTSPTVTGATVAAGGQSTVVVTNTVQRQTGSIQIKKALAGATAGYVGSGSVFHVGYVCTLAGASGDFTGTLTIPANAGFQTLASGIPYGWSCAVYENGPTADLLVDGSYAWTSAVVTPAKVVVADSVPVDVTVTNTIGRTGGKFAVTKVLQGVPADAVTAAFTGTWQCQYGADPAISGTWTAPASGGAATLSSGGAPVDGSVLTGSVCSAAETAQPALVDSSWSWSPPAVTPAEATVALGNTATVTVTNTATRVYSSFSITKANTAPAVALRAGAKVTGSWQCTYLGASGTADDQLLSGQWSLPASGGNVTITQEEDGTLIPAASTCVVREDTLDNGLLLDASYAWATPVYAPASTPADSAVVTTSPQTAANATVTNSITRVTGQLVIDKVVKGGIADPAIEYSGTWQCVYDGAPGAEDDATQSGTWTATNGDGIFFSVQNVLVGSVCTVLSENTPADPKTDDPSWVWSTHDLGTPTTVTGPSADGEARIVVTNTMTRLTGALNVQKKLVGATAVELGDPDFTFTWSCTPGDGVPAFGGTFTLKADAVWNGPTGIPNGSLCKIQETVPTAGQPTYTWQTPLWASGLGEGNDWVATGYEVQGHLPIGSTNVLVTASNPVIHNGYTLSKTSDPASGSAVKPGDVITYSITVNPFDRGTVHDVVISDDLSSVLNNATLVPGSITAPAGTTAAITGTTLAWTIGTLTGSPTLPPLPDSTADAVTLTYQVTVNADAWNVKLVNAVTGKADVPCSGECEPSTNHPTPGYGITKTSDPVSGSAVKPGQVVTYTLTASNTSQAPVTNAVVVDDLSDVLDDATMLGTLDPALQLVGNALTWTVPPLDIGGQAQVSYSVTVKQGTTFATLRNVAVPKPNTGGECLPTELGGSTVGEDLCATEHPIPAYTLSKSANPASGSTVLVGDIVTYTLTVVNASDVAVTGVTVTDNLAGVLADADMQALGDRLTLTGTMLTWAVPDVPVEGSVSVSYSVKVLPAAAGKTLVNMVVPDITGGCTENCTTTHPVPNWTMHKTSNPPSGSTVKAGDVITWTLSALTLTSTPAPGVVVTDDLGDVLAKATLVPGSLNASQGSATITGNQLVWNVGTISGTATATFQATVKQSLLPTTIGNTVMATGEQPPVPCVTDCATTHKVPPQILPPTIPSTGSDVGPGTLAGALALLMVGAALVADGRRRTRTKI